MLDRLHYQKDGRTRLNAEVSTDFLYFAGPIGYGLRVISSRSARLLENPKIIVLRKPLLCHSPTHWLIIIMRAWTTPTRMQ